MVYERTGKEVNLILNVDLIFVNNSRFDRLCFHSLVPLTKKKKKEQIYSDECGRHIKFD